MSKDGIESPDYRDARTSLTIGPGQEIPVTIRCDFEPDRVLPDPDARVLQLERARALRRL
jgi:hypothetical protein